MTTEEEKELINKAQKDPEAFGIIFDNYYTPIFNYCLRRVSHKTSAEDLTSEIFFKALNALPKFRWQNVPFSAWLYRIASNEVISFYRKNSQTVSSLEDMQEKFGFDLAGEGNSATNLLEGELTKEQQDQFLLVKQCLERLPEHYKEVLSLRYFEKLSIIEVAQILDKPEGTIKSLLSRGADLLREQFNLQPL